jgi:DNA gyrase subunit A
LVILNNLYKRTPLQSTFSVNTVALVDGIPRTLNVVQALQAYIGHQMEVIRRRSQFRLDKARDREHIVDGLLRALNVIDEIIALIRRSEDAAAAREGLMAEPYSFSEVQAQYILDLPLRRLTRLARIDLLQEQTDLLAVIAELEAILGDEQRLRDVIKEELAQVKADFANERRTRIEYDPGDFDIEDLIDDEDFVFTMSASGYVKTMAIDEFRTQGRGGRGVNSANLKDEDYILHLIHTSAHAYLLFFSNRGRVYRLKTHEVPVASRQARGTNIVNLLQLQPGERIQAVIDTRDYETNRYLFFATRRGRVKKTRFNEYDSSLKAGLIAVRLNDDDELVSVIPTNGDDDVLMVARSGQTVRFHEENVRAMGRSAAGVTGMRFRADDELIGASVAKPDGTLFIITEAGFGKRTPIDRYPTKGRGGLGVIGIRITEQRGKVAAAFLVNDGDDIVLVASGGTIIRLAVDDVSVQGRDATGVRLMNLDDNQYVAAATIVKDRDEDDDTVTDVSEPAEHTDAPADDATDTITASDDTGEPHDTGEPDAGSPPEEG